MRSKNTKPYDPDDNLSEDKSRFWLFPPLPDKNATDEMSAADEAELKKRNQRRDDIRVYLTMAIIVLIAALVTIGKIFVQKYLGLI